MPKGLQGFQEGNHPKTEFKKGHIPWHKGKTRVYSENSLQKMGVNKGRKFPNRKMPPRTKEHQEKLTQAISGEKCNFWKGGISFEPYSVDWTETLRRSIRERDNYICQLCNQYGYYVHHKNYDKKNCNPDNLITLCHRCHNKTNQNREYWINYFNNKINSF